MKKDFENWNIEKQKIHFKNENKLYHQREVWWCSFGINIGFEQNGDGSEYQRPVLIIKGFSKNTCLVLPLTTSVKIHKLRISVGLVDGKEANALLSQIRVIDTKRLVEKVCFIDKSVFETIRKAVKDLI